MTLLTGLKQKIKITTQRSRAFNKFIVRRLLAVLSKSVSRGRVGRAGVRPSENWTPPSHSAHSVIFFYTVACWQALRGSPAHFSPRRQSDPWSLLTGYLYTEKWVTTFRLMEKNIFHQENLRKTVFS